jgi:hypothetical protein
MNNWFVGFAMGLLTLLAYEKLQEDPPPEVDIPITANDIVEAYKAGKRDCVAHERPVHGARTGLPDPVVPKTTGGAKMKAMVSGVPYPVELDDPRITDQELQEIVLAVMTSGMRQKGARYNLPESMLMEIGKRCFDKGYTAGQKGENDGKTYS